MITVLDVPLFFLKLFRTSFQFLSSGISQTSW